MAAELPQEARLPDTRLAGDRHELDRGLGDGPGERLGEERELVLPSHEGGPRRLVDVDPESAAGRQRAPDLDGLGLALDHDRLERLVVDPVAGGPEGHLPHNDAVHGRHRLEARRRVDDVARDDALAVPGTSAERDDGLAGVDPDADGEVEPGPLVVHLGDRADDPDRGADGSLGVVLVGDGCAEDRHDRVADELLDRAAEALDVGAQARVIRAQGRAHVLRVRVVGAGGEADQVAEQHGHELALLAGSFVLGREGGAAGEAEPRAGRVLLRAGRAGQHRASVHGRGPTGDGRAGRPRRWPRPRTAGRGRHDVRRANARRVVRPARPSATA